MTYHGDDGGGSNGWLLCYLISLSAVLMLDCFRGMDFRAADILTNCIVFLGVNYIANDLE